MSYFTEQGEKIEDLVICLEYAENQEQYNNTAEELREAVQSLYEQVHGVLKTTSIQWS